MTVLFDYGATTTGTAGEAVELMAQDAGLDHALVRLADSAREALPLSTVPVGAVIQHPDGRSKRFGIRNDLLTAAARRSSAA